MLMQLQVNVRPVTKLTSSDWGRREADLSQPLTVAAKSAMIQDIIFSE